MSNLDSIYNTIRDDHYDIEISTDASLTGMDKTRNINYLERTAIKMGILYFAKERRDCSILLRTDNTGVT